MLNPDHDIPAVDGCPACHRPIAGNAEICPYCGSASSGDRYRERLRNKHVSTFVAGIFLIVLGCIMTVADPSHALFELPAKGGLILVGLVAITYGLISLAHHRR